MVNVETRGVSKIEDPDLDDLGPAMLRLSPGQRRFVIALVYSSGTPLRAAIEAGYKTNPDNPNAISVTAHRLSHDKNIQAAIAEVGFKMMNAGIIPAVKFVLDTIANPQAEMKDRIKCSEMVMNRTGLHATTEQRIAVTHKDETSSEMVKQIEEICKNLGVDSKKLLGGGTVTDAEYSEVPPEDDLSDIL